LFYSSRWCESGGPGRVAYDSGADSMFQFQCGRGDDGTKRRWKIKRRQQGRLGSMERKCDTARQRDNVGRRISGIEEGKERRR
jgi:hypothetical protein